jgi:hypothetical protein
LNAPTYNGGVANGVYKPDQCSIRAQLSNGLLLSTASGSSGDIVIAPNATAALTFAGATGIATFVEAPVFAGGAPTVSALTSGRVVLSTTGGQLTDSPLLTFDSVNGRLNINGATSTGNRILYSTTSNNDTRTWMHENTSTGTAAQANIVCRNSSGTGGISLNSTGFTTSGIRTASDMFFFNGISGANTGLSCSSASLLFSVDAGTTACGKFDSSGNLILKPNASITPAANGDLAIQATSNTSLTFKYKGSDGTVRSGSITLA